MGVLLDRGRCGSAARRRMEMTNRGKIAVGGVAVGLLLWWLTTFWIALAVIVGVPAIAYLTLDPSQRRRLRRVGRKEIRR